MNIRQKIICSITAAIAIITGGVTVSEKYYEPVGQVVIAGQYVGDLLVSPAALSLIGNAEGCRRDPYKCPAGLVTNGIGNTHGVPNEPISIEQVSKDWVFNIQQAERCLVASAPDLPMTQGQIDAFTSFIFNTGCTRFRKNSDGSETRIYKKISAGRYDSACDELKYWVYGGGKKLNGLVNRRQSEMELCLGLAQTNI
ncbi:lysozyme [Photobacterium leiognathi]|uniref:lysozyme n=1 Tax=Photobacterium leiognathi TaxID=553611 RepID=UPI0002088075|nr:lysozyme [Photobacterium leiognathi]PSW48348.1 lysozyme [Photobacterium leiognathi subsp. mandapamensis]GAA03216.1 phage lysozyme family protein [Photobacterium leiognathi subsp. mandapamensis svers.1.1.]